MIRESIPKRDDRDPVFISFPHEGKRPYFLKIDDRFEEVMLESLTEVIPSTAGEIEAKPAITSVRSM